MILYHGTTQQAWESIRVEGLEPKWNKEGEMGIIYLAPDAATAKLFGPVVLRVMIRDQRITAFEECRDWELLCWGKVPVEDVRRVEEDE